MTDVPNLKREFSGLVGQARDNRVLELVREGHFVAWPMHRVATANSSFEVQQDYFALLDEERGYVRWPMSAMCAQRVADELGLMLPTPRMVDLIWKAAMVRVDPMPWGPPYDSSMYSIDRYLEHNRRVEMGHEKLSGRRGRDGLLAGAKKDIVITARLAELPEARGPYIYGWHRMNGTPIQTLTGKHRKDVYYADYSHGVRLCSKVLHLEPGLDVPLEEALARNDRAALVSNEGALPYASMRYSTSIPGMTRPPPAPSVASREIATVTTPTEPTALPPDSDRLTDPMGFAVGDPEIKFVQAKNYTPGRSVPIDLIVIHTMEAAERLGTAENVAAWFAGKDAPVASAHYCIDGDSIVQCVKDRDVAWHAPGANHNGIGIEHAGYARQTALDWADEFSHSMLLLSARLVAKLCNEHSIPIEFIDSKGLLARKRGITTHDAVSKAFRKSNHYDPGVNFPMAAYLDMVRAASDDPYVGA